MHQKLPLGGGISPLMFGLFYIYILVLIDPSVFFYQQNPVFITTFDYFRSFLDTPGGVGVYASLFLGQFYLFPWAGALVVTLMAWLFYLNARRIIRLSSGTKVSPFWSMIPVVILLGIYGQFNFRMEAGLPILIALGFFNLYSSIRFKFKKFPARLGLLIFLSGIVYWLTAGNYLLFALLVGIYELLLNRDYVSGTVSFILGGLIPFSVG